MNSWVSLIPPLLAIFLAMTTRQVVVSLWMGIFAGAVILNQGNVFSAFIPSIELVVKVIADPDNARMLLFSLMIGSLVALVQKSGGVGGFVDLVSREKLIDSPRKAGFLANMIGTALFLEGSMSILTVGTVSRSLFKKFKISKEKLAYIADSTAAPAKVLIPLNGWGAYLMMQFKQGGVAQPFPLLIAAIPFFLYPWVAYLLTHLSILIPLNIGPMKAAEMRSKQPSEETLGEDEKGHRSSLFFLIPVIALVAALFSFMAFTGGGNIMAGDGSKSILYSIFVTLFLTFALYRGTGIMKTEPFVRTCIQGMNELLEVVMILALAFSMNAICKELKTGLYAAGLMGEHVPLAWVPFLIFVISALISFATGTSWGTFAIMLSIALPMANAMSLPLPLIVGAVVSGGVWGDHCSPISDTTVLSALASQCSLMEHFRTQIPYALTGGAIAGLGFLVLGILL